MHFRKPPVTIHAFGNFLKESTSFPYICLNFVRICFINFVCCLRSLIRFRFGIVKDLGTVHLTNNVLY